MFAKFSTLYALEILNVMRDYNEIYLSIFSVFHEIMLRAKWTSRNDDRISTFRGSLQGGRTVVVDITAIINLEAGLFYSSSIIKPPSNK